jgi:cytochrome P450
MILYPGVQLTAQRELDSAIGPNRLPSFEDRNRLPYVEALYKEVLRWHPLLTTALAHRLIRDDVVNQYFIPAGTTVLGNSWSVLYAIIECVQSYKSCYRSILHSEAYGPDAMTFKPERFLHAPDMDPAAAFGFGRR